MIYNRNTNNAFFENVRFLNESSGISIAKKTGESLINENCELIKNCDFAISEEAIREFYGDMDLVEQHALLEGAKFDLLMKNFLKEGKDYKGLKADLKEIIEANDLDDSKLASKGKGLLHVCKRVLQICCDIDAAVGAGIGGVGIGAGIVGLLASGAAPIALIPIIYCIVGFIVSFIINRLIRLLVDHIEFDTVKKDAQDIVSDLRKQARSTDNKKLADKYTAEADKLEAAIAKYSKKNKD